MPGRMRPNRLYDALQLQETEAWMKVEITEREKAAIEQGLSRRGVSEVSVKVENGKVVVLQVEKKKIV